MCGVRAYMLLKSTRHLTCVILLSEILLGALTRVLRDDGKKSFDLATNIVSTFYNFSLCSEFQAVIARHKVKYCVTLVFSVFLKLQKFFLCCFRLQNYFFSVWVYFVFTF